MLFNAADLFRQKQGQQANTNVYLYITLVKATEGILNREIQKIIYKYIQVILFHGMSCGWFIIPHIAVNSKAICNNSTRLPQPQLGSKAPLKLKGLNACQWSTHS